MKQVVKLPSILTSSSERQFLISIVNSQWRSSIVVAGAVGHAAIQRVFNYWTYANNEKDLPHRREEEDGAE